MTLISKYEYENNVDLLKPFCYTHGVLGIGSIKYLGKDKYIVKKELNNDIAYQLWLNMELFNAFMDLNVARLQNLLLDWEKGTNDL